MCGLVFLGCASIFGEDNQSRCSSQAHKHTCLALCEKKSNVGFFLGFFGFFWGYFGFLLGCIGGFLKVPMITSLNFVYLMSKTDVREWEHCYPFVGVNSHVSSEMFLQSSTSRLDMLARIRPTYLWTPPMVSVSMG